MLYSMRCWRIVLINQNYDLSLVQGMKQPSQLEQYGMPFRVFKPLCQNLINKVLVTLVKLVNILEGAVPLELPGYSRDLTLVVLQKLVHG